MLYRKPCLVLFVAEATLRINIQPPSFFTKGENTPQCFFSTVDGIEFKKQKWEGKG